MSPSRRILREHASVDQTSQGRLAGTGRPRKVRCGHILLPAASSRQRRPPAEGLHSGTIAPTRIPGCVWQTPRVRVWAIHPREEDPYSSAESRTSLLLRDDASSPPMNVGDRRDYTTGSVRLFP